MTSHLAEMASGKLTQRMDIGSKDEIGQVAASLNSFLDTVEKVIVEVKGGTASIASAAQQVSSSARAHLEATSSTCLLLSEFWLIDLFICSRLVVVSSPGPSPCAQLSTIRAELRPGLALKSPLQAIHSDSIHTSGDIRNKEQPFFAVLRDSVLQQPNFKVFAAHDDFSELTPSSPARPQ